MEKLAETKYPVLDVIRRRWSPRIFADRPVDGLTLGSLFEAARWAASCYNEQPWVFIVATKDDPENYAKLLSCLVEFNQSWAKSAPVLMLTVARLNFERNGKPNRHALHDVGLAMGNLCAEATSRGLFLHQMAGILVDRAREVWKIPEGFEAVAGIALGYMGDASQLDEKLREREIEERKRKPLEQIVFSGEWGKASSVLTEK